MDIPVRPRPMLAVADVPRTSRWYQEVLAATSGHGGDEYEVLLVADEPVLQLHRLEEHHHHAPIGDPAVPLGNGVAVWFAVADFDAAVDRVRGCGARVVTDAHHNPNAQHREIWLHDPDGYLVVLSGA